MNKTVNINLGQRPFIIDEDAYLILSDYIHQLEQMFADQDSQIVADIEYRFSEILLENLATQQIVTTEQINRGIEQIGRPETIGGEESYVPPQTDTESQSTLYRSTDDKIIGGVASGIANYFGITENFWVRLIFVLMLFTPLTILYILLWAVLPPKALKHQPPQSNNLKSIIRSMISEIKRAIHDLKKSFVNA